MSTQTSSGHSFPTPCKRCGGALNREVEYCPYCGTVHPLDTGLHKRAAASGSRTTTRVPNKLAQPNVFDSTLSAAAVNETAALATAVHASTLATLSASLPQPHGTSIGLPVEYSEGYVRPRIMTRNTLLGVVVVAGVGLVLAGYALFRSDGETDSSAVEQASLYSKDATTTTGSIALYMPTQMSTAPRSTDPAIALNPARPAVPVKAAPLIAAAPAIPVTPVIPLVAAAPVKPVVPQFRDVNQALQTARAALRSNNLTTAQNALAAAQTLQPGNATALAMSNDMKPMLAQRDSQLQAAQACFAQQSWACARQHANEALVADSGSEAASSMLERIITQTGWAPLNLHATTSSAQAQSPLQSLPLQSRAPVKAPGAITEQASLQRPLPLNMPAANDTSAIPPRPAQPALDPNSVEARERAIRESGWSKAAPNGSISATGVAAGK